MFELATDLVIIAYEFEINVEGEQSERLLTRNRLLDEAAFYYVTAQYRLKMDVMCFIEGADRDIAISASSRIKMIYQQRIKNVSFLEFVDNNYLELIKKDCKSFGNDYDAS